MAGSEFAVLHDDACQNQQSTYTDPATGMQVFTAYFHQQRGYCCGNKCRHCPFEYEAVPGVADSSLAEDKRTD